MMKVQRRSDPQMAFFNKGSLDFQTLIQTALLLAFAWVMFEQYQGNGTQQRLEATVEALAGLVEKMETTMVTRSEVLDLRADIDKDMRDMRTQVSGAHGRMSSHDVRLRRLEVNAGPKLRID